MKAGIHPAYEEINVVCACGHTFKTRSAHKGDIRVEICSSCHPFFTGKQKLIDTEGRVDRFQKKYQKVRDAQAAAAAAKKKLTAFQLTAPSAPGSPRLRFPESLGRSVYRSSFSWETLLNNAIVRV